MKKVTVAALALTLCLGLMGCTEQYADFDSAEQAGAVLGERVFIDGVDVSGLSPAAALSAVESAHAQALKKLTYRITAGDDSVEISGEALPISFNTREVIVQALSLKQHWPERNQPRELHTAAASNREELKAALSKHIEKLEYAPKDAAAKYNPDKLAFDYTDAKDGRSIDAAALAQSISAMVAEKSGGQVSALTSALPAEYTLEMAKQDTKLISEFSTSFAGSTYSKANRVFNIKKAASLINGVTLAPGEELDMNAVLGDRNEKNGWKTATGIRDGVYVQEYGGGVCQVSTTLYNAALMADLEITERHHHSWPLGYVDIGRDATISTGGPNLKIKNNSEGSIILSAFTDTDKKTVTVRLYGKPLPNGVTVKLTSKKTATLSDPGYETVTDSALAPGSSETVREARRGSTAETYKLYYNSSGELIDKKLVTEDKYRSIKGLVKVSPYSEEPEQAPEQAIE